VTKRGDFLRRKYGRYGYRRVRQLLVRKGLKVRRNKLNGAASGSTTGRAYGSGRSVLWSYDSMRDHTEDGRRFRILTGIGPVSCSGKFSLLPAGGKTKSPHWRGSLLSPRPRAFVRIGCIALCAAFSPKTSRLRATGVTG
jgi:hypothetical protein